MRIGKVLCSLLLASSAGLVIGLLFAPDKGSQTRKRIRKKAGNFLEHEIIGYNRIICDVTTKLDQTLKGLTIQSGHSPRDWADTYQKNEIIV